ncbi:MULTISPECIES: zinc-binding dehydrogenase [unclassified Saccharibacter]|uniref:zinc-binding dehydrogenase n=1 Tax=unclassified Saccharibacter TaxID=2648722 RepID=UPI001EF0F5D1|nr:MULTISPECIES: zinc-binding dehydrogenase [unclassified Saccharibacter]
MVGATAIAITRTRAKKQALLDAGATHVIVSDEEDIVERVMTLTNGQGARVVFDPVGGPSFEPLTQSMARGGILLLYGALSTEPTPFPLFTVLGKSLTLKGFLYAEIISDLEALERAKAFILKGLESGELRPLIAKTFSLDDIQEAHKFLEANQQIGKIIVTV